MFTKKFVILSLHVNDILLAQNNKKYVIAIEGWLSSKFEMKDMGEASYILDIKIYRECLRNLVALS